MSDTTKKAPDAAAEKPQAPAPTNPPENTTPPAPDPEKVEASAQGEKAAEPTPAPSDPAPADDSPVPQASDIEHEIEEVMNAHFDTIKELDAFRLAPDLIKQLKQQHNTLEKLFVRLVPSLPEA